MKWEMTKTLNGSDYWHLDGYPGNAMLRFNADAHSIRLLTGEQRLYFMEKTGMLQSRILLKSEYNVQIGECYFGKNKQSGIVSVRDHKYTFKITGDVLILLQRNREIACELTIPGIKHIELFEFSALLFGSSLVASKNLYPLSAPLVA
jgi:hypothetical protein